MSKHKCPEGYVQVTDIKVMQKLLLQLMVKFHEVCEKHGLIYNMCGGTLLGAVRHKGFIPWDDDLDVCMPRADYEKFIQIAKTEYKDDFFTEAPGDENYIYPYLKIGMKDTLLFELPFLEKYGTRQLYLDIFPVDGFPNDLSDDDMKHYLATLRWTTRKFIYPCMNFVFPLRSATEKIKHLCKWPFIVYFRCRDYRKYIQQFLDLTQKYKFEDSERVVWNWSFMWGRWTEKKNFLDRVKYDFEGYKFWSAKDYDSWLTRIYGDYMTLPPPEKRVQYHGYELFVKEELLENL